MRNIKVVPYDSGWIKDFEDIRSELQNALGDLALRIEHVGSTSVPVVAPGRSAVKSASSLWAEAKSGRKTKSRMYGKGLFTSSQPVSSN